MSFESFFSFAFKRRRKGSHASDQILSSKQKLQGQIDSDSYEAADGDANSSTSASELSPNGMWMYTSWLHRDCLVMG